MGIRHAVRTIIASTLVFVLATCAVAGEREVKVTNAWRGSVENVDLMKDAPKYVLDREGLERLWRHWRLEGAPPEVDFSKELVLVATTRGSHLNLTPKLDDATGDLTAMAISTMDLRPGFRYVIGIVSREGIRSIEGTPLDG